MTTVERTSPPAQNEPTGQADSVSGPAPSDAAAALPPDSVLRNQTAYRLLIAPKRGGGGPGEGGVELQLPPYGEVPVAGGELAGLELDPWLSRSILTVSVETPGLAGSSLAAAFGAAIAALVWALIVWAVWSLFGAPPDAYWPGTLGVMLVFGAGAALSSLHTRGGLKRTFRGLLRPLSWGRSLLGSAANALAVGLIALGVPGAVILATGGWAAVARQQDWHAGQFATAWIARQLAFDPQHLVARGLQLVLIALLACLPAALYFLFDRRKLGSLRDRFLRSVLILDPNLRTLEDVRSVHGARIDEVLGAPGSGGRSRIGVTRQVMVPLTTLLMALGWTLSLDPAGPPIAVGGLLAYFVPARDPLVFAFLGGYLFAMGVLLRRYVRSDLKPESLASVLVRILGAVLIAWAASLTMPDTASEVVLLIAFVIGVFPESGLQWLQGKVLASVKLGTATPEHFPLDRLDGMNIYHRSRLMDEGVDNLENLAHSDLFDLLLETRFPMGTLVDWVDQAILVLHAGPGEGGERQYAILREHGIRSATDLERGWREAQRREAAGRSGSEEAFLAILGAREGCPPRIRLILDAIEDDQWMPQLREVRKTERTGRALQTDLLPWWDRGDDALFAELERRRSEDAATAVPPATPPERRARRLSPAPAVQVPPLAVGEPPGARTTQPEA